MEQLATFGVTDYCVMVAVLVISVGIGVYASLRGTKSPEEFLMGGRSFGSIPVAMSLLTSYVSAISLLGYTGEVYAYGIQIMLFLVGTGMAIAFVFVTILPVLFPLRLTSVNEYVEQRFNSKKLAEAVSFFVCMKSMFYMGVCLYAPTIALASITPLSSLTYIFILGAVVTLYSSIGGIRAVVWTDVFQLSIMFTGLIVVLILGIVDSGGIGSVWSIAREGGRLNVFNMNPSIYERHNFYNTIFSGFFYQSAFFGISQINVQRLCSVQKIEQAKTILKLNGVGMVFIYVIIFSGGVLAYSTYAGCDPLLRGVIEKKEEIMPYYITEHFPYIIGLPGLFVATLIGGALSSLSSVLNAIVAMIWRDGLMKIDFFSRMTPTKGEIANKVLSFLIGGLAMAIAVAASHATNLIQFSHSVAGSVFGGIYGVYLLGFLFPRTNLKGAWTGLLTSIFLVSWISAGSFIYKKSAKMLPLNIDKCPASVLNGTFLEGMVMEESKLETLAYEPINDSTVEEESHLLMYVYGISYTLYCIIGTISCILVGVTVSFFTGNRDLKEVNPKYITPFIRKLYWSEEELRTRILDEEAPLSTSQEKEKKIIS